MRRADLAGRLARVERELAPRSGWQVWWSLEDEPDDERRDLVRNAGRRPSRIRTGGHHEHAHAFVAALGKLGEYRRQRE